MELLDRLHDRARSSPAAPALREIDPRRDLTCGELAAAVEAVAARLSREVPPGVVVLLVALNRAEFVVAALAVLAAGCRVFPLSPESPATELRAAAARAGAVAAIGDETVRNALTGGSVRTFIPLTQVAEPTHDAHGPSQRSPATNRDDASGGLLLQSSGTTGRPKLVFRNTASLDAVARQMVEAIGFGPSDRSLAVVPLCHSYGFEHGLLCPVWSGACAHLCRGFNLGLVRRELSSGGVTILPGVPFMFEMLAEHADDVTTFPTLRRAYSAGGPLPASVYSAFASAFGVRVGQLFGATEIGSVTFGDPDLPGFEPASVGRPMRGVEVRILDAGAADARRPLGVGAEGLVAVRAASMLTGYVAEPDPREAIETMSVADGFFLTGDLGRVDEQGNLFITGRLKLLIDVGGLKVNPLEVEQILLEHPQVASCVVVPVRVTETVNRLKAIVTARLPAEPPTLESLRAFARGRLVPYKVPRAFEVRPALPKSPTGKILRHLVEA